MLAGRLLCRVGMEEGKFVTFFPSYGAEMRGGTANCQVIISDDPIGSPVVDSPDFLLCFNKPSFIKFTGKVAAEGGIIINSSLYEPTEEEKDEYSLYEIPANTIAEDCGNILSMNAVMIGAAASLSDMITLDSIKKGIPLTLGRRKEKFCDINIKAAEKGAGFILS